MQNVGFVLGSNTLCCAQAGYPLAGCIAVCPTAKNGAVHFPPVLKQMPAALSRICIWLQRMVQHALALKSGKTYKDVSEEDVKPEEATKGMMGKITGLFRST